MPFAARTAIVATGMQLAKVPCHQLICAVPDSCQLSHLDNIDCSSFVMLKTMQSLLLVQSASLQIAVKSLRHSLTFKADRLRCCSLCRSTPGRGSAHTRMARQQPQSLCSC